MEHSFGIPLKPVDQTDKEAEYYRDMVVKQGDTIEILKQNVHELQGQLQQAYRRIAELREALDVEIQENRNEEDLIVDYTLIPTNNSSAS